MSIAAAENAGLALGPCDLPLSDPWVTHATQTSGVFSLPLSSSAAGTAAVAVSSAVAISIGGNYHQTTTNTLLQHHHQHQQATIAAAAATVALQQHSPKIMNAVASAATCPTSGNNRKIRRKTDNKPQSQINKCNNEKRRRELENNYIEQLGEFLQLNKRGDMTSTKPDKAAILNQVVKTYRDICDKGNNTTSTSTTTTTTVSTISRDISSSRCTRCPNNCADTCTIHPVQQGEVSSTEPPLPEPTLNGQPPEISAYFEALEHYISSVGWILVQINPEGIIESCTQNIKELIGYERSELHKQPIYSYLHAGDHAKLSPILNNMSFTFGGWDQDDQQHTKNRRSITDKVRMLCKHPEGASETMEQKQQRQDKYEEVVLIAAPVKDDGDDSSSVLCLITRPEEESPLETNMQQHTQQTPVEQMTMKLDTTGKIIQIDTSCLRKPYAVGILKERGRLIQDICHIQDVQRLQTHLKDVQQNSASYGTASLNNTVAGPFRLRLGAPDAYVHVKSNSRLFPNATLGETDYIMSVQTILSDGDASGIESPLGNNGGMNVGSGMITTSLSGGSGIIVNTIPSLPSTSHHHTTSSTTTNVGGPLMTSVINSNVPQPQQIHHHQASHRAATNINNNNNNNNNNNSINNNNNNNSRVVTSFSSPPSASESSNFFPESFDFDFQHSTFEMESAWDSRPDSRTSVTTPVNTPRPPSVQAFSPVGQNVCPSPLTPYHTSQNAGQPSPQNNNNNTNNNLNNNNNNSNNNNGGYHGFAFPNFDEKDQKDHINNNNNANRNNNINSNNSNNNNSNNNTGQSNSNSDNNQNHDSERLRILLTVKKTQSSASSSGNLTGKQDHRNPHEILKTLLNNDEEKDGSGTYKINSTLASRMNQSRSRSSESKSSNNHMLLQLLNDKSDDDDPDSRTNRVQSELLRQLQKDDTPKEHSTSNNSNQMGTEELINLLRYQGNEYGNRKRSLNEPDDGVAAKRTDDKPSKLREKNKMLASLLSNPSKAPTNILPSNPVVKIIPDITSSTVNRVSSSSGIGQHPPQVPNNHHSQVSGSNSSGQQNLKVSGPALTNHQSQQQHTSTNPHANQSRSSGGIRKPSDTYLSQQMPTPQPDHTKNQMMLGQTQAQSSVQHQQRSQQSNYSMDSPFSTSTASPSPLNSVAIASSSTSAIQQIASSSTGPASSNLSLPSQNEWDPELSKILNDVIDFVPDLGGFYNSSGMDHSVVGSSSTPVPSQQDINEKMAINAIQKSLMQFESSAFSSNPPAYSTILGTGGNGTVPVGGVGLGSQQSNNQGFHPPPIYSQRSVRIPQISGNVTSNQALRFQMQMQRERLLQQQQKERLLQQQQKQHMVVPETARGDQLCLNPGMPNIGSLLNNTVAPNVSLTRNTLPDSQLSPGFSQGMMQQQLSPGTRNAPFSPQQSQGYQQQFPNNGQRLSPQQQQQLSQVQQQQMTFQTSANSNSTAQLSPRQSPFNLNAQSASTGGASSGVGNSLLQQQQQPSTSQQNQQWNAVSGGGNSRISLQQHNPMLSAQLQGVSAYSAARQFQSRRSLNSPGATISRQNSFPTQDTGFPGPSSPSTTQASYGTANVFNNQQLQRLNRQTSVPQATQHLPGSPRSFGGSDGTGGYGMMYNSSMQHAAQGPPPNDFYIRTQTAGNSMNSSEYVRQELRAVVSGRTQQSTGGNISGSGGGGPSGGVSGIGASGGSGVGSGSGVGLGGGSSANNNNVGLRTPQSPLGLGQGPMVGGNSTNSLSMTTTQQQQQEQPSQQSTTPQQQMAGTPLLNTPPDPTLGFNFDLPQPADFFGTNTTR